ncbi:MAG TPA: hypothetical protein DCG49_08600 [Ruminococcus sp.]|nr:hypothetical protein [Ruminococcus sp.]
MIYYIQTYYTIFCEKTQVFSAEKYRRFEAQNWLIFRSTIFAGAPQRKTRRIFAGILDEIGVDVV